ncbi:DUF1830 domain-containing protein [Egbenema bharatensis]|uniref:DUF1830 domain-containing protein n=1 Tax=Egbenema bharatensis TaxID=3463334 RepID=UPI003A859498
MNQVFTARPQEHPEKILCYYVNATSGIQVVKIQNPNHFYFERVVFPGQRLFFEALPTDQLEIYAGGAASTILADTLLCQNLQVEPEIPVLT